MTVGATDQPLLRCEGVEVAYGSVKVLFGVDLDVRAGEIVALLGTNGAGKSTLLKAISQLAIPSGGRITFDGQDTTRIGPIAMAKAGVVQVPGGKATFPTLTVAEHFTVGRWLFAKEDPKAVQARTDEVLDLFPRLRERWGSKGGDLSGGEQQQLAVGMAFVAQPKLLIIDELSLGLAPAIVEQLLGLVRRTNEAGCAIVLVEQSVNVALTVARRAVFMEKGEVRFEGATAELLGRGDLLRSVFLEGAGAADKPKETTAAAVAVVPPAERPPILEVDALYRSFGGVVAVNEATFTLHEGEVLGLIGPNGAGKTTIFDLISGITPLERGTIRFLGHDVTSWSAAKRAAAGLGRSFQDARIFPGMTVAENVGLALERHLEHRDHLAQLLCLPEMAAQEQDIAWTVADLIELLSLGAYREKLVGELSTGTRRIVDLAMALGHDPRVLLLDEPSSGVAQRETEALPALLRRIQSETGCALLVIEHDMPMLSGLCDELVALELGAVVTQGPPAEVLANPQVVSAYLGGDLDIINRSGAVGADASERAAGGPAPKARRQPRKAVRVPADT